MLILINIDILAMVLESMWMEVFFSNGSEVGRNVIIFGVDMSSSVYIDNNKKNSL